MPLLQVNAIKDRPELSGAMSLPRSLATHIDALPDGAPIVVMIHGYKFSPFRTTADPHRHILSLSPVDKPRALSWPRHLGFGRGKADEGLCIAFGWEARGTIWQAYAEAGRAGTALARMIEEIGALTARPVHIIGHSLGARVALCATARARAGSVGRVIMLAAAEFQSVAAGSLSGPVGCRAEFINILSRENDVFDLMVEKLLRPFSNHGRSLGHGLTGTVANWLDVPIDHPGTLLALVRFGHRIPAPTRRVCHWWGYLRPGMLTLYSDLIRKRRDLPLELLRRAIPDRPLPRWSRLFWPRWPALPLPFARKTSS